MHSNDSALLDYQKRCEKLESELARYRAELEELVNRKTSELQLSEERLELALKGAEMGMWDWDIPNNKVIYSKTGLEILGYTSDEFPTNQEDWQKLVHPDDIQHILPLMEKNLKGEIPFIECEYRLKLKSGKWKWVLPRGKVVERDAQGQPLRQVGIFIDIDDRKRIEAELDVYRNNLEDLVAKRTTEFQAVNESLQKALKEHREIENALRQSEEKYRLLAENVLEDVWQIDLKGTIIYSSPGVLRVFGYTPEEVNGLNFEELIAESDIAALKSAIKNIIKGKKYSALEIIGKRKDGSTFPMEISATALMKDGKTIGVQGIARDISRRKFIENELLHNKARLEEAHSIAKIGSWEYDVLEDKPIWSPEMYRIFDINPNSSEPNWQDHKKFIHAEDWKKLDTAIKLAVSEGRNFIEEFRIVRPDDKIQWGNVRGNVIKDQQGQTVRLTGVVQDITDQKLAEQKIRENEEHMVSLMSNLPGMVYRSRNIRNWDLTFVSEGVYALTGYHPHELINSKKLSYSDLIHIDDRDYVWNTVQQAIKNKTPFELEYRIHTQAGELKYVWERGRAILGEDDRVIELEGFITDISDLKLSDKLRRESENRFRLSFEASGIGMVLVDAKGKFILVNNSICRMLNYTEAELLRLDFIHITHHDDLQKSREFYRQCIRDNKPYTIEKRYVSKDGRTVWGFTSVSPIFDDVNQFIYAVAHVQDITEQKMAEVRLREAQGNLEALIESTDDIVVSRDLQGRAIAFNSAFAKITKKLFDIEAKPGIRTTDYLPHNIQEHWNNIFAKVHSGQKHLEEFEWDFGDEVRYYELSFNPIWADNKVIGSTEFNHDITERKLAERKLKESEEKYNLAMQATSDGLYDWNVHTNEVYYSPNWKKMLGYAEDELENHLSTWEMLTNAQDIKRVWPSIEKLLSGEDDKMEIEFRMRHKDGHWVNILSRGSAIYDDSGKAVRIVGTHIDVTQRRKAGEALRKSEEQLREAQKVAHIGHWEFDPDTGESVWSDEIFRMFGIDPQLGEPPLTIQDSGINPDDWTVMERALNQACTDSTPFDLDFRIEHPEMGTRWIQAKGRMSVDTDSGRPRLFGTAQDITELKLTENALKKSETQLRVLIETIPDMIWLKDINGVFIACNPRFELLYNAPESEIVGKTDYDFVDKKLADFFRQKDMEALTAGKPTMNEEEVIFAIDGHREMLETIKTPLYDTDGHPIGVLGIARDITERRNAAAKIEESEEKYRSLFENMMNGFALHEIILDDSGKPIDYIYHEINMAFEKMTGLKREEIIGQPVTAAIPDIQNDPADWIGKYGRVALSGSSIRFEQFSVALNKWFSVLAFSPRQNYFATIIEDITDRKRALSQLEESEEKYRSLVENIDLGIALIGPDMKILSLNRQMKEWFPKADDIGVHICYKSFNDPPLDNICSFCPTVHVFRTGKVHEAITETPTNEGMKNYRVVSSPVKDSNGKIIAAIESVEDYTTRIRSEMLLKQSESKFRSYIDNAPDGIFVTDENGFYIDVNNAATRLTGYTRDELLTMHISDLAPDELKDRAIEGYKTLIASGKLSVEVPFMRKNGSIGQWTINCTSLGGNRYLCFVNDITETKQLRDLQSRAARLETAGKIAGQVAHDFNNLLGPIMAYPEFIRDELPEDHVALTYLKDIENAARKIADINQDLLTMGRRGHFNQEILNLNTLIEQTVHEIGSRSDQVSFDLQLSPELMNIRGGSAQLHRMLTNMLNNAFDAMQNSGKIAIKTENYYIDDEILAYTHVPRGEYIRLILSDTGCGIPEDIIYKIFDPFFTTKTPDQSRGSGLGMSVVDSVVKDHKGYLDLESEIGRGTTFYLYFPVCRKEIDNENFEGIIGGSESILVVDDDNTQLNVTRKILEKLGYQVTTINNGEKAVEFISQNPHDLIILDMIMPPGIDGTETYKRILEINPEQKAIIVSGYSESNRVLEAQKLGVGTFVRKPLTKHTIAKAVRQELNKVNQPAG